jgi:MFS transporter, putative metabolite:H+ symporter
MYHTPKQYRVTLLLLCIGYFIDFYDLTIFSAGYTNIIKDLFDIHDPNRIQQLYLSIANYYSTGIFIGCILFGILSDKYGRTVIIRYSILIYSLAIIASVFAHSVWLFSLLRFVSGVGLATEFATSSVLISELLPQKDAARSIGILYFFGVLGGMSATYLGVVSWQVMFLAGGISGLLLYMARKKMFESQLFLNLKSNQHIKKGNLFLLLSNRRNIIKFIRLWVLMTPFFFLISIMFIYPNFMPLKGDLAHLIRTLLFGFFIGNLISTLVANVLVNHFKNFRVFMFLNTVIFAIVLSVFPLITKEWFIAYAILLGLLGGGLPTVWVQLVARSYGVNQRGTATNSLNACGRLGTVLYNLLASFWISNPATFSRNCIIFIMVITLCVFIALFYTENNYGEEVNYLEPPL